MAKYPRPSQVAGYTFRADAVSEKKPGYFQNDTAMAIKAFRNVGMIERTNGVFSRHPLAFLTEAADDVCYAVADLEDGFKVDVVTFQEVHDVLVPIASQDPGFEGYDLPRLLCSIIKNSRISVVGNGFGMH